MNYLPELDRWNGHEKSTPRSRAAAISFMLKGVLQDSNARRMAVWLHEERSSVLPYGALLDRDLATTADADYQLVSELQRSQHP